MRDNEGAHERLDDDAADTIISYVMGLLDAEDASGFERHIAAGCRVCEDELSAMRLATAWLNLAVPPELPPSSLRDRIREIPLQFARTSRSARRVVLASEGSWEERLPGMFIKELDYDAVSGTRTILCRMEPGASSPAHRHVGPEQSYVVKGEISIGDKLYRAGDYLREPAGTKHPRLQTAEGCLLLIISSEEAAG